MLSCCEFFLIQTFLKSGRFGVWDAPADLKVHFRICAVIKSDMKQAQLYLPSLLINKKLEQPPHLTCHLDVLNFNPTSSQMNLFSLLHFPSPPRREGAALRRSFRKVSPYRLQKEWNGKERRHASSFHRSDRSENR